MHRFKTESFSFILELMLPNLTLLKNQPTKFQKPSSI